MKQIVLGFQRSFPEVGQSFDVWSSSSWPRGIQNLPSGLELPGDLLGKAPLKSWNTRKAQKPGNHNSGNRGCLPADINSAAQLRASSAEGLATFHLFHLLASLHTATRFALLAFKSFGARLINSTRVFQ